MKILIIGGTRFLGRRLVEEALAGNHEVTVFHRGSHPHCGDGDIEEILGDRNTDLQKLVGREWDAVIDTCGYLPDTVAASVDALKESVRSYVFISSISAYGDFSKPLFDENTALACLTPDQDAALRAIDPLAEMTAVAIGDAYGGAKVLCEEIVEAGFPGCSLIVRPGLIVGAFDHTDRFTYWVMRVAAGGAVLAPGKPESPVQFIDAKDLASWTINATKNGFSGAFSVTGKPGAMNFGLMLDEIKIVTGSDARFVWAPEDFLRRHEVREWSDLPLYMFESEAMAALELADTGKATGHGLKLRPFADTVTELYQWRTGIEWEMRAGLSKQRESELLRILSEQLAET
jgi:2'-hydroxyisoflavone reductase